MPKTKKQKQFLKELKQSIKSRQTDYNLNLPPWVSAVRVKYHEDEDDYSFNALLKAFIHIKNTKKSNYPIFTKQYAVNLQTPPTDEELYTYLDTFKTKFLEALELGHDLKYEYDEGGFRIDESAKRYEWNDWLLMDTSGETGTVVDRKGGMPKDNSEEYKDKVKKSLKEIK